MKALSGMMLVSRSAGALYECRLCGSPTALSGSCRRCGVPAIVEGRPMRRHARPPADWMLTLAHNLSVAGFGALMFKAGDNHGFHMGADESQCTCQWAPGRGEPYRPSSRCEQEDDSEDDQRAGCVLGERCLAADPFHTSDECFDAEMAEAFMGPEREGADQP